MESSSPVCHVPTDRPRRTYGQTWSYIGPHGSIAPIFHPKSDCCVRQRGLACDGTHLAVLSLSGDDTFTHQPVKNTRPSFPLGPKFPNVLPRRHFVCVHLGFSTHCAVLYNNDTILLFNNDDDDDDIAALHFFGLCYYCLECWNVFTTLEVELLRLT
jgi:hypothetical protein